MTSISIPSSDDTLKQMKWLLDNWEQVEDGLAEEGLYAAIISERVADTGSDIFDVMNRVGADKVVWQITQEGRGALRRCYRKEIKRRL